jgi:hypothetical protein
MAPPARRTAQAEEARRLSGNAVGRHQLLLLPDRTQEAQRVRPEAQQPHRDDGQQSHYC